MSFPANWFVSYNQGSSTLVTRDTDTPIIATGSLEIDMILAPERVSLYNDLYSNGQTSASMRSIFRITTLTTTTIERVGFVFMQNAATIDGVLDAGYGVFMNAGNGMSSPYISLVKYTTGLPAVPTELAITTSFDIPELDDDFCLWVGWVSDIDIIGGTQVYVKYAFGTNFLDLEQVLEYADTSSPIITSSFESLAASFEGSGEFRILVDETSIFQIT
jgi:hypothetical protein